jgi:hypothetical protein
MNLGQIRAAVNAYTHRTDAQTLANVDTAIAFAQAAAVRDFRPTEAQIMAPLTFVADGLFAKAPLPPLFLEADAVYMAGVGSLDFMAPRALFELVAAGGDASGVYTIASGAIMTEASAAGASAALLGWEAPAVMTADGETNWLASKWPEVLVWFAVAEQFRFGQDFESADQAEAHAHGLVALASNSADRARLSGGRVRLR